MPPDTSTPTANLAFLPWVRQGAASVITTVDTRASSQPAVADLPVGLAINGGTPFSVPVRLRGPADVIGINAQQVVRMEPRPGSSDFEPNYFPCVEFDRADFPWLFTPLKADANARLRPWLVLIVVRAQDGVAITNAPDAPLPMLRIAAPARPADELPDLVESWAWAHGQAASGDAGEAAIGAALGGAPQLSLSRLLCPRLLAPNTDYIACVVPAFELGRRVGLGLPVTDADLIGANALAPAWSLATPAPLEVQLPVYVRWSFRTGVSGDFESLARRLVPQPAPQGLGQRPIAIDAPGFELPAGFPAGATLALEGALQTIDAPDAPASWPANTQADLQAALADIIDTPGRAAALDPGADPILAPPLYGHWFAARAVVTPGAAPWLDELNLDPRWRTVAAFGTRVVQVHQEALMASAWEQAAELQRANQRMRQLQMSLVVGSRLHDRHFATLAGDAILRLAAPAFGRIRSVVGTETSARTVVARLAGSTLPLRATGVAMRTVGRTRGPLTRRVAAQGVVRLSTASWVGTLSLGLGSFLAPPALDLATVDGVRQASSNPGALRSYSQANAAAVAAVGGQPYFQIVPEGQPVPVLHPPVSRAATDDPAAAAFRAAASAHLTRLRPERPRIMVRLLPPLAMDDVRNIVREQTHPRATLVALASALVQTGANAVAPTGTPASEAVGIDTVMAAPRFPQPMYAPLRDLSQQLLLPGVDGLPEDGVFGLKTNRRFVESFLVGLNVEMAAELLWRGFPTDQRGTCFAQFWDTAGADAPRLDIAPLSQWQDRALGAVQPAVPREQFVMLMRSALLRRYPNAMITSTRAVMTSSNVRAPSTNPADETAPAFRGTLDPDISFFGFDFDTDAATGADGSAGRYIVIQEHPTEPRFGLDVGTDTGSATHLGLGAGPPTGLVPGPGLQWGRNAAHMAGIVRQLPVRICLHASRFIASS
ncbi:MAG: hypothetical protein ABI605_12445 [Rhizobacter sp.]